MNQYKLLEKILGSKFCPDCGKTLKVSGNEAYCSCGFFSELEYKDRNRNKNKKTKGDYRKTSMRRSDYNED